MGSEYEGGVEQVTLRARVHREETNWLILTDCSNAFNTVKRTAVLAEVATCAPALTPFVQSVTGRDLLQGSSRWNREKGARSIASVGGRYNKGMPWGRRCSACLSCRS